jgi:NTP pyrophosphatase (non-canonical NTP hydrolase)
VIAEYATVADIVAELETIARRWGHTQSYSDPTMLAVLAEEMVEVVECLAPGTPEYGLLLKCLEAIQTEEPALPTGQELNYDHLYDEIIQVAAVAVRWAVMLRRDGRVS